MTKIRFAQSEDSGKITTLLNEGFGWDIKNVSADFFNSNNIFCLVAEDVTGNIIGTATLHIIQKIERRAAQIEDVVVSKKHRGKKTGQELIKSLVALSKEKKCYKITLNTHKETIPFYTRLGFNNEQYQMVLKH
tara:strand:- start:188 stop:589 length:402 start_codon:yes stop_codon:yes gene_type:complete